MNAVNGKKIAQILSLTTNYKHETIQTHLQRAVWPRTGSSKLAKMPAYPAFKPISGANLKDKELVDWLNKRLGDELDIWTCRSVASFMNQAMIDELSTCFQGLETQVKMKILMGFALLQPRHLHNWQTEINTLLDICQRDPDDWIELIGDMFRRITPNGVIELEPLSNREHYVEVKEELHAMLKHYMEKNKRITRLPKSHQGCEHKVIEERFGFKEIEVEKHFGLKKRTKSDQLKADVLKSIEDNANLIDQQKKGIITSSLPIKIRSTVRKPDTKLPMRAAPQISAVKSSGGFTNEPKKFQRTLAKREGGAKLIAIDEIPQAMKKRRKEQDEEDKKKKREEAEAARKKAIEERAEARKAAVAAAEEARKEAERQRMEKVKAQKEAENAAREEIARLKERERMEKMEADRAVMALEDPIEDQTAVEEMDDRPGPSHAPVYARRAAPSYLNIATAPTVKADADWLSQKVREQAIKQHCSDMLKTANKMDLVGQQMMVAFMSGNKTNPRPELGNIITLKLSDSMEDGLMDGQSCKLRVETFFQMDYASGEWKRLRKCKVMDEKERMMLQDLSPMQKLLPQQIEEIISANLRPPSREGEPQPDLPPPQIVFSGNPQHMQHIQMQKGQNQRGQQMPMQVIQQDQQQVIIQHVPMQQKQHQQGYAMHAASNQHQPILSHMSAPQRQQQQMMMSPDHQPIMGHNQMMMEEMRGRSGQHIQHTPQQQGQYRMLTVQSSPQTPPHHQYQQQQFVLQSPTQGSMFVANPEMPAGQHFQQMLGVRARPTNPTHVQMIQQIQQQPAHSHQLPRSPVNQPMQPPPQQTMQLHPQQHQQMVHQRQQLQHQQIHPQQHAMGQQQQAEYNMPPQQHMQQRY